MQKSSTVALISSNRLLLLKRGETAPWNPNKYCLPGGKLEPDESLVDCAVRELFEETSIKLSSLELIPLTINYPKYSKVIFVCSSVGLWDVKLNWEHSEYIWATPEYARQIDLVPGLDVTIKCLGDSGHLI